VLQRGDLGPAPGLYFTYYARVGGDVQSAWSLQLPLASPATYGAENCGTTRTGTANGWVCDPALWWKDAAGNDVRPRYARGEPIGRVPGDWYNMRDVDCYDGSLARGSGVHASGAAVSGAPCQV
ncbi:MAG TPA: hypothetical protein VNX21_09175, partial [Candidatus Thermoplasmatota archaeon]|nr:hypothetical protein [Candidatus Thermoplasmatota archaeon]